MKRVAIYLAVAALALGAAFWAGRMSRKERVTVNTRYLTTATEADKVTTLGHQTTSIASYTKKRVTKERDGSVVTEVETIRQRDADAKSESIQKTDSVVSQAEVATRTETKVPGPSQSLPNWKLSFAVVPRLSMPLSSPSTYSVGLSRRLVGPLWLDSSVMVSPSHMERTSLFLGVSITW